MRKGCCPSHLKELKGKDQEIRDVINGVGEDMGKRNTQFFTWVELVAKVQLNDKRKNATGIYWFQIKVFTGGDYLTFSSLTFIVLKTNSKISSGHN